MNKEVKELTDFLNSAHGEITITINGMTPHVKGDMNDSGAILAAFSMLKMIEQKQGHDMKEVMEMLINLNDLLDYQIIGRIGGEDIEYGNN